MKHDDRLNALMDAVSRSSKYQAITPDLVRSIGERELSIRSNVKQAVKATKNKLHQIGGAYFGSAIDYADLLDDLRRARVASDDDGFRAVCRQAMGCHASTRERLPILDSFFSATLSGIGPLNTILDLGCGLTPLSIPWMPLGEAVTYYACDIYVDLVDFVGRFLDLVGVAGEAEVRDICHNPPTRGVDLALMLKLLPCLEQLDRSVGPRLLETVDAKYVLVSFPARSLGGRCKAMVENYGARFNEMIEGHGWTIERFDFPVELAFLITK
ncbi:MAG: 16S rRNA methyltransferase [Chloroflexi bacterium]|nr:16S rRNA methyltransferase [Chloroflexota bacterium]